MSEEEPLVYALRIAPRAKRDIEAIFVRFGEIESVELATEWEDGVYIALGTLASFPRRFAQPPEEARFQAEVRQMLYRRTPSSVAYRVLYSVTDAPPSMDGPVVRVLHVRHSAARPVSRAEARAVEAQAEDM